MLKKNKGKVILFLIIIILLVVSGIFVYKRITKKEDLKTVINEMSVLYYQFYYDRIKTENPNTYKEKLANKEKKGFKASLFEIARNVDHKEKYRLYNSKSNDMTCDFYKTYVEYHPKAPYGKKDYKMDITVSCKKIK